MNTERQPSSQRTVGVLGGGTAGYFAALAIKQHRPDLSVTVVESSRIPIIGVGEATTTLMPPFLHRTLGLDIAEMWRAVRPTFKLGIRFEWGLPDPAYHFDYPFGMSYPLEAAVYDGDLRAQSLMSLLMDHGQGPVVRGPDGQVMSLLPSIKFAYHLDNASFVRFLRDAAVARGVEHLDVTVDVVERSADGQRVERLRGDGRELRFDAYVDATGFRALLVGDALESPFLSYASSLFCDRALVATVPQREVIRPYTTAECMENGWCWNIPVRGEDHRGYVYASAFVSDDEAHAQMLARNPAMRDAHLVRFRSGRRRELWRGNAFAVGNAYGFVEPLESTALHMVIVELGYVLAGVDALLDGRDVTAARDHVNRTLGDHWDYLRWFLSLHYKFNRRYDTPFWQAARADVDVSGFAALLREYAENPTDTLKRSERSHPGCEGTFSLLPMLLGQKVPWRGAPDRLMPRERWEDTVAGFRRVQRWALPQRESLTLLDEHPEWLEGFVRTLKSPGWSSEHIELPSLP